MPPIKPTTTTAPNPVGPTVNSGTRPDHDLVWDPNSLLWVPAPSAQVHLPRTSRVIKRPPAPTRRHDTGDLTGVSGGGAFAVIDSADERRYSSQFGSLKILAPAAPGGQTQVNIALKGGSVWNFLQGPALKLGIAGPSPSHYLRVPTQTADPRNPADTCISYCRLVVSDSSGFVNSARVELAAPTGSEHGHTYHDNTVEPTWNQNVMPMHAQFYPTASGVPQSVASHGLWTLNSGVMPNWAAISHVRIEISGKNPLSGGAYVQPAIWIGAIDMVPLPATGVLSAVFDQNISDQMRVGPMIFSKYGIRPSYAIYPQTFYNVQQGGALGGGQASLDQVRALRDNHGWEIVWYDWWTAFQEGIYNFGGPGTGGVSPTPGLLRSFANELLGVEQARAWLVANGFANHDMCVGQPRKLAGTWRRDILKRHASYSRCPTTNEWPQYWPPDDPLRCHVRITQNNFPGTSADDLNSFERIKCTIDRAVYGNEWLTLLFHNVEPDGGATGGDSSGIPATAMETIFAYATGNGKFDGTSGKVAECGAVLSGMPL